MVVALIVAFIVNRVTRQTSLINTPSGITNLDCNCQDRFGRTALQWAAEQGHVQTVEILLDMGANIHERDNMGR